MPAAAALARGSARSPARPRSTGSAPRSAESGARSSFAEGLSPDLEGDLAALSAGEREVIALRILLELDGDEAARVLGISPTAVSTRLSRALKKLEEKVSIHV